MSDYGKKPDYGNRNEGNWDRSKKTYPPKVTAQDKLRTFKEKLGNKDISSLILSDKSDANDYLNKLDNLSFELAKKDEGITTAQIRKVFTKVKQLEHTDIQGLHFLRPHLAYMAGRAEQGKDKSGPTTKAFAMLLDELIREVKTENDLSNFKQFFEAVIAYHKFHGGK